MLIQRVAVVASLLCSSIALAQSPTPAAIAAVARPADVASIDAVIDALYASISGAAGVDRQWERFKGLFAPGARLIPTGRRPDSSYSLTSLTPDEYIARSDAGLKARGFFEKEVARKLDRFGNIVQLFSTYESRRTAEDPTPFARGINSIQLHFDGTRWWIVTVYWEAESAAHPIPSDYLPRGGGKGPDLAGSVREGTKAPAALMRSGHSQMGCLFVLSAQCTA